MAIVSDGAGIHESIAAFDIGSNSIKMTAARWTPTDGLTEFLGRSATVRLGAGIEATGRLADDRIDAAMTALTQFAADARAAGVTRLIGVATEATRVAANGESFLNRVRTEVGLELVSISGEREAELTFRGIQAEHHLDGNVVIADIGGGSTEIIVAIGGEFQSGQSIALGSGRLTDRLVLHDPPTRDEIAACRDAANGAFDQIAWPALAIDSLIAVGGTGEYLIRLVNDQATISPAVIDTVIDRIVGTPAVALAVLLQISEARARVLPAGIAIVRALAERLQPASIEGARSGIRTGLLMAAFVGAV